MLEVSSPDTLVLCDGEVWLLFRTLSYPVVCALLPDLGDGVMRIVVDPAKPDAMAHVLMMVAELCDSPIALDGLAAWVLPCLN